MVFGRSTLTGLFTSALLVAESMAKPHGVGIHEKRQSSPIVVTGVQGSGVQQRLEVRSLQANADQWNMYLLGLQALQNMDQDDVASYYQLAGIHGLPMMDWNGVGGNSAANPPVGYCTHVSNLFLTWHRPYLAVYEQLLVQQAVNIANQFQGSDQQRYLSAAQNLRIPYWDWAAPQANGANTVPDVFTQQQVSVNTPTGQQTIDNPVYTYKFHPVSNNMVYSPFTTWTQTYRHPNSQDATTSDNDQDLVSTMNGQQASLASRLFNLFANYQNFQQVSNDLWAEGQSGSWDSIESIHDTIHGLVGGGNNGDMSIIDVSAFDPAFWMHHTMVDRFFAMWQTLYPDTYVDPAAQAQGNYWYNAGDTLDVNTALKPFYADANGNFHTSTSVRSFTNFGYTYPETASGNTNDIVQAVNTLYGANQPQAGNKKRSDPVSAAVDAVGDLVDSVVDDVSDIVSDIGSYLGVSSDRDYIVNLRSDKSAIDGSYSIFVFIGDIPADVSSWTTSDNLVGIQSVQAMMEATKMASTIVSGTIPLTHFLEKHVVLKLLAGLDEDLVLPYLTDNLNWKVVCGASNEIIDMPSLKVGVVSTAIQKTDSITTFPKWTGGFTEHYNVTSGKENGLCESEAY